MTSEGLPADDAAGCPATHLPPAAEHDVSIWNANVRSVDAWLERVGSRIPADVLLSAFDQAMAALWARAQPLLGEITLEAIADRVLYNSVEQHSFLFPLKLEHTGLSSAALAQRISTIDAGRLREGLRFFLIEFLTVVGSLTGEILSSPLQAELLQLPRSEAPGDRPVKKEEHGP